MYPERSNWNWNVERKKTPSSCPSQALLTEKAGTSVFTVVNGGRGEKTPVVVGFNDGVNVELPEGLPPGQAVILVGKQALNDGQAVSAVEAK